MCISFFLLKLTILAVELPLCSLSGANIVSSVYGIPVKDPQDPYLELSKNAVRGLVEAGIPGTYLVDFLPMLKYVPVWFPGAGFQSKAAFVKKFCEGMANEPFDFVKRNMVATISYKIYRIILTMSIIRQAVRHNPP